MAKAVLVLAALVLSRRIVSDRQAAGQVAGVAVSAPDGGDDGGALEAPTGLPDSRVRPGKLFRAPDAAHVRRGLEDLALSPYSDFAIHAGFSASLITTSRPSDGA